MRGTPFRLIDVVKVEHRNSITYLLQRRFSTDPERRDQCKEWWRWPNQRFCTKLLQSIPDSSASTPSARSFLEAIPQNFDLKDSRVEDATDAIIGSVLESYPDVSVDMQLEGRKMLMTKLPVDPVNFLLFLKQKILGLKPHYVGRNCTDTCQR